MASYLLLVFLFAFCAAETIEEICLKIHNVVRECKKAEGREGFRLCLLKYYELEKQQSQEDDLYNGYRDRLANYFEEETKKEQIRALLVSCMGKKDVLFCGIEKLANSVCPAIKKDIYWT